MLYSQELWQHPVVSLASLPISCTRRDHRPGLSDEPKLPGFVVLRPATGTPPSSNLFARARLWVWVPAPRRLRGAESQGIKDLLVGLTGVDVLWVPAKPHHPGPNDRILQRRCDQPEDVGAVGCPGGQGLVVFLVGFGDVLGKGNERVCRVPTTRAIVIPTSPVVTRLSDSRVRRSRAPLGAWKTTKPTTPRCASTPSCG